MNRSELSGDLDGGKVKHLAANFFETSNLLILQLKFKWVFH